MLVYHMCVRRRRQNSVALVRKRIIPTERPLYPGEVSAKFSDRGVSLGQRNASLRPSISISIFLRYAFKQEKPPNYRKLFNSDKAIIVRKVTESGLLASAKLC
jgi:hypothetical protein